MITDKDREDKNDAYDVALKILSLGNTESTPDNISDIINKHATESADQARKEAADRAVEWIMNRLVPGVLADIIVQDLRYSILTDNDNSKKSDHVPDIGEKLAIAVKALEEIESKHIPSNVFESQYSRLQEACTKARDALKEIQG